MKLEEIKKWFVDHDRLYSVSLELTQNCNFQCKHCYCSEKNESTMPFENWKVIIDKIFDTGCLFISFTGGEILTHKDFREIYSYAKQKGFLIDLLTNGSLINKSYVSLFKELPPRNISITIYGTNEEEYQHFTGYGANFNKVINSLALLKDKGISFSLRTLATKTLFNSLRLRNFEKIAAKFNVAFRYDPIIFPKTSGDCTPLKECLSINHIMDLEKNNESRRVAWKKIINSSDSFKWKCRAGINSFSVDYKGDVFVCGLYRKNPISILENDIETVLKHLKAIHEEHVKIINENECAKCEMRYICKWCPAYSNIYNNGNEINKIKFFCDLSKARLNSFKD